MGSRGELLSTIAPGSGDTDLGQALTVLKPSRSDYASAPACCAIPPSNPWVEAFPKLYPLFRLDNWGRLDGTRKTVWRRQGGWQENRCIEVSRAVDWIGVPDTCGMGRPRWSTSPRPNARKGTGRSWPYLKALSRISQVISAPRSDPSRTPRQERVSAPNTTFRLFGQGIDIGLEFLAEAPNRSWSFHCNETSRCSVWMFCRDRYAASHNQAPVHARVAGVSHSHANMKCPCRPARSGSRPVERAVPAVKILLAAVAEKLRVCLRRSPRTSSIARRRAYRCRLPCSRRKPSSAPAPTRGGSRRVRLLRGASAHTRSFVEL